MNITALDLGCGRTPKNPFNATDLYGVDIQEELSSDHIKIADLAVEKIPFENDFFDVVTAFDFIEHIPRILYCPERRFAFVELMNEVYRVLKTGGLFYSMTPVYPHPELFRDPTHVNLIAEDTFVYYFDERRHAKMYGFQGAFRVEQNVVSKFYLHTQMRKIGI